MSELFEEVEEIPKTEREGRGTMNEYDEVFKAIKNTPVGTKGKLKIPRNQVQNYYSALIGRTKAEGLGNAINFRIRNAKREKIKSESGKEYQKLLEGDLFFEVVEEIK